MKMNVPKQVQICLILAAILLLGGCNDIQAENAGLARRILVWHAWNETETETFNKLITSFNAVTPEVKVIVRSIDSLKSYDSSAQDLVKLDLADEEILRKQFIQQASLGLGPDLLVGSSDWVRELADAGLILDLSDQAELDMSKYLPGAVETLRYNGKIYGLPLSLRTKALYYNKKLVQNPPETLDFLMIQVGQGQRIGLNVSFDGAYWGVPAFGGQLFDESGRTLLNQGGFASWLTWLKRLQESPYAILDTDRETLSHLFKAGQMAYYVGESEELNDLQAALGEDVVGVAPLPAGPNGQAGPLLRTEALMFNAHSSPAQAKTALKLAQFLTAVEMQTKLVRADQADRIPENRLVRIDPRVYPAISGFQTQARTAIPVRNIPQMDDLLTQVAPDRKVALPVSYDHAFWGAIAFGSLSFDAEYRPVLDAEGFLEWLRWLQKATQTPGLVLSSDLEAQQALFLEGKTAYLAGESSMLGKLQTTLGSENVGVAPLPAGPAAEASPLVTVYGLI